MLGVLTKNHLWYSLSYRCLSRVLCGGVKDIMWLLQNIPLLVCLSLREEKMKTPDYLCAVSKAIWWKDGWNDSHSVSYEIMHNHHRPCQHEDIMFSYQQWLKVSVHVWHFFTFIELRKTIPVKCTKHHSCPEADDSLDISHVRFWRETLHL